MRRVKQCLDVNVMANVKPKIYSKQHTNLSLLFALLMTSQLGFATTIDSTASSQRYETENLIFADSLNTNALEPVDAYFQSFQFEDSIDNAEENLWDRIRAGFSMPDVNSQHTSQHEQYYSERQDYVERMLERSSKYLFHIVEEVESRGMPLEIALLPMVESAFNPKALSSSKASGIWQFMPATGKDFGLKQNYWADSRRDVKKATDAALTYLQRLHGMFGSWDLALAAYNAGEGTVSRAIAKNRRLGLPTDYEHLPLPLETRHYVPKLQAIKNIVLDPEQFGLSLNHIPNAPYFTSVKAPKQIDAKLAAELAGISQEEFNSLNPSFKRPVIVAKTDMHQLLLPTDAAEKFVNNLANYDKPLSSWQIYKPKRGERITTIAQRFDIDVSELRAANNLPKHTNIALRRAILVPLSTSDLSSEDENAEQRFQNFDQLAEVLEEQLEPLRRTTIRYKVRKGDTLTSLARRYGMPVSSVMSLNNLRSKKIIKGQILVFKQVFGKKRASKSKRLSTRNTKSRLKTKSRHKVSLKKHAGKNKPSARSKSGRFKTKHRR